jgi:hypothetical protein
MFIDELSDDERGLLVVALKYWRAQRAATAKRRTDPFVAPDAVDVLLAKLQAPDFEPLGRSEDHAADLFPR